MGNPEVQQFVKLKITLHLLVQLKFQQIKPKSIGLQSVFICTDQET